MPSRRRRARLDLLAMPASLAGVACLPCNARDVNVAKNQVATANAASPLPSGDAISEAAKKLSEQSYPFLKEVNWLSDIYLKPLPGVTADKALKAIDKLIVMGAAADGKSKSLCRTRISGRSVLTWFSSS